MRDVTSNIHWYIIIGCILGIFSLVGNVCNTVDNAYRYRDNKIILETKNSTKVFSGDTDK